MAVICNYYSSEPWVCLTWVWICSHPHSSHVTPSPGSLWRSDLLDGPALTETRQLHSADSQLMWHQARDQCTVLSPISTRWWYLLISSLNITININSEGFLMLTVCWWLKLTIFVHSELLDWEEWWVCDGTLPRLWSYGGQSCLSIINISASVTSRH